MISVSALSSLEAIVNVRSLGESARDNFVAVLKGAFAADALLQLRVDGLCNLGDRQCAPSCA